MQIATAFWDVIAVMAGGLIGLAFGKLQEAAARRNQKLENSGQFNNAWSLIPGSGGRVACLLIALALVQIFCPMLFAGGCQWWVSGGVVLAYGWTLYRQLRHRLTQFDK